MLVWLYQCVQCTTPMFHMIDIYQGCPDLVLITQTNKTRIVSVRASSQVLSERNTSNYGSLYSLASDYPAIPGNDRPHSV